MPITGEQIGIGLRAPHYHQVLIEKPQIDWLEVHTENFMMQGGPLLDILLSLREHYPLSFHGVGLSLGSAQGICKNHLKKIKSLIYRFEPALLSDHLSWSNSGPVYLPDLLPVPYTQNSLTIIANNIDAVQNYLQRSLLIENPSSYFEYKTSSYSEAEFLTELVKQTGVKILLDINNVYVSCHNNSWDPHRYIQSLPRQSVKEIHLAGHSVHTVDSNNQLLIDTHDNHVSDKVWDLFHFAVNYIGQVPTLIEWDTDLPDLEILLNEAKKALPYLRKQTDTAAFF